MADAVIRIGGETIQVLLRGAQGPRGFSGPDEIDFSAPDGAELIGYGASTVAGELGSIIRVRGDGVTDLTTAIQTAMAEPDTVVELSGDITVSGSGTLFDIKNRQRITGNAVITHDTTTGITFSAVNVDDWQIDGRITVVGDGGALGSAAALYVAGGNRYSVSNFWAKEVSGWHIKIDPGSFVGPRGDTGTFTNCGALDGWYSLEGTPGTGAEYIDFLAYKAGGCRYGPVVATGNWSFTDGSTEGNVDGFLMIGGANNGHGNIKGHKMNHNAGYNFRADGVSNGQPLVACAFYGDSSSAGKIVINNSRGVRVTASHIDGAIEVSSATGRNVISGNTLAGTYTSVTCDDWTKLDFSANSTLTGLSDLNRPMAGASIWVKFHWSGSAIVIDGGSPGVSVVRNGLGDYNITWPQDMPGNHYGLTLSAANPSGLPAGFGFGTVDANGARIYTYNDTTTQVDPLFVYVTALL